ncbi:hypothetical protein QAD02_003704 [Eretmocerus hayati]|uniref:Uncharacterized protein n=2 Tax=Eretmocerus hayati TaxID=131215 RepID=A0ACC2NMH8_9HYME|nr:hypothetical protein QAD02_003704 [Eretmocerus hayati]
MTDKNPKPTHTEKDQHLRSQLEKAIEEDSKPLVDVKAAILEKIRIQEELVAAARAQNPNDHFTIGCLEARRLSLLGALKYQPISEEGPTKSEAAPENPTPEEKLLLEVPCNLPEHLTLRRSSGCVNLPAACDSTTSPSGGAEKPLAKGPETPPSEEEDSSAVTSTQPTAVEEKRQKDNKESTHPTHPRPRKHQLRPTTPTNLS